MLGEGGRSKGRVDAFLGADDSEDSESVSWAGGVLGGSWISMLQPLLMPSTSKPSRRTRILPHESQLGGTRILSRLMTLCLIF